MNSVVSHLISGRAIFTGLGLMALIVVAIDRIPSRTLRRLLIAQVWLLAIVSLSTAAVSWAVITLGTVILTGWTATRNRPAANLARSSADCALLAGVFAILSTELAWTRQPPIASVNDRAVIVLGDSLSAGLGEGEGIPWPQQLSVQHNISVTNLSQAGATTKDGPRMAAATQQRPGLVIIELGGNDLLGGRTARDFESDLAKTLKTLREQQRTVVMVELPLLLGKNSWGVIQRRLASRWDVTLIPKRFLVDVLTARGSTVDTLHLSQLGHQRMAELVWSTIEPALPATSEKTVTPPQPVPVPVTTPRPAPTATPAPPTASTTAPGKPRTPALDEIVLFQPSKSGNWQPQGLVHQDVEFTAADGTQLYGWYCPADQPRAVVLYCHGNGGNIAWLAGLLEHLRKNHQLTVLAFDYRGYGKSQGLPTVEGVIADGEAARVKLAELSEVPVPDQMLWGHSMGGAVAVQLARKQSPRALILESTFDSFQSVARYHTPQWAFLVQPGKLDSVGCISDIHCPLLQIHGTADRVVPIGMGLNLFSAANEPKQFLKLDGVDHNERLEEFVFRSIDNFIDQHRSVPR